MTVFPPVCIADPVSSRILSGSIPAALSSALIPSCSNQFARSSGLSQVRVSRASWALVSKTASPSRTCSRTCWVHRRHHGLPGVVGRVGAYGFVLQRYAVELQRPFLSVLFALHLPTDESPPDLVSRQCIDGEHERPRCALSCYCEVVEVASEVRFPPVPVSASTRRTGGWPSQWLTRRHACSMVSGRGRAAACVLRRRNPVTTDQARPTGSSPLSADFHHVCAST